jgi:hypothetical protein
MKNIIYLLIITLFLLTSCKEFEQEISWDTKDIPEKLIVEGSITTNKGNHPITLKYSDAYFANKPAQMVTHAEVSIEVNKQVITYSELAENPGVYVADEDFAGLINETYTLTIHLADEIEDEIEYKAESELIEGIEIDSVYAELYLNPVMEDENDTLTLLCILHGQEPEDIDNYYMIRFYKNGELLYDTISEWLHFSDQSTGINGDYGIIFFYDPEYEPGDLLGLEIFSIPKTYHLFLEGVNQIYEPGDPFGFSGPPANAVGNINDGQGLGFFYASHVSYGETVVVYQAEE